MNDGFWNPPIDVVRQLRTVPKIEIVNIALGKGNNHLNKNSKAYKRAYLLGIQLQNSAKAWYRKSLKEKGFTTGKKSFSYLWSITSGEFLNESDAVKNIVKYYIKTNGDTCIL